MGCGKQVESMGGASTQNPVSGAAAPGKVPGTDSQTCPVLQSLSTPTVHLFTQRGGSLR